MCSPTSRLLHKPSVNSYETLPELSESVSTSSFSSDSPRTSVQTPGLSPSPSGVDLKHRVSNGLLSVSSYHDVNPFKSNPLSRVTSWPSRPISLDTVSEHLSKLADAPISRNDSVIAFAPPPRIVVTNKSKWVIVLVGLPATGKSTITKQLLSYLNLKIQPLQKFRTQTYNAGEVRREMESDFESQGSDFFNFANKDAAQRRELYAHIALNRLLDDLIDSDLTVGFFDATNSTVKRRKHILKTIQQRCFDGTHKVRVNTIFFNIKCTSSSIYSYNILRKAQSPDYINKDKNDAINDFLKRAENYKIGAEIITNREIRKSPALYVFFKNLGESINIIKGDEFDCYNKKFNDLINLKNSDTNDIAKTNEHENENEEEEEENVNFKTIYSFRDDLVWKNLEDFVIDYTQIEAKSRQVYLSGVFKLIGENPEFLKVVKQLFN